jgi:hypothetical protein
MVNGGSGRVTIHYSLLPMQPVHRLLGALLYEDLQRIE